MTVSASMSSTVTGSPRPEHFARALTDKRMMALVEAERIVAECADGDQALSTRVVKNDEEAEALHTP